MCKQAPAYYRNIGNKRNLDILKSVFNIFSTAHSRPSHSLDAITDEEINAESEGSKCKSDYILISVKRNCKNGKYKSAKRAHYKRGKYSPPRSRNVFISRIGKLLRLRAKRFVRRQQGEQMGYGFGRSSDRT